MKIQDLDEPQYPRAAAQPPAHLDHRVVVPLEAVAPAWERARGAGHLLLPDDPTTPEKDVT